MLLGTLGEILEWIWRAPFHRFIHFIILCCRFVLSLFRGRNKNTFWTIGKSLSSPPPTFCSYRSCLLGYSEHVRKCGHDGCDSHAPLTERFRFKIQEKRSRRRSHFSGGTTLRWRRPRLRLVSTMTTTGRSSAGWKWTFAAHSWAPWQIPSLLLRYTSASCVWNSTGGCIVMCRR